MRALAPSELLLEIGTALAVPRSSDVTSVVKAALRRASFILAPCGRNDLLRFVASPLERLGIATETIDDALDELIVYGDLLELHRLDSDPWDAPAVILRPAPPCFVRRQRDEFIILGVAGDHPTALTADIQSRVVDNGGVRTLHALPGEDLASHLRLLGLVQLSEHVWLRTPAIESAKVFETRWRTKLNSSAPITVSPDGLEVLDSSKSPRYYRGRWTPPTSSHTGFFVARRSQLYGSALWCVVEMQAGAPVRLLDIHADDDRQRPCDLAWRLQASIDASRGNPQRIRTRHHDAHGYLDFFSPLPAFAERRLSLVAEKKSEPGCLFTFEMPTDRLAREVEALQATLWMAAA